MTDTDTSKVRAELEQATAPTPRKTVLDLIARNEAELQHLLGPSMTVDRFRTIALTTFRNTPGLYECEPFSVVGALRLCAQLGLEPGPLGLAYVVPFKGQATFVLGYKGMIQLAYRSGLLKSVQTAIVREGDGFDWRLGTRPFLDHVPSGPPGDREWLAVYAVAQTKTGGAPFAVLTPEEVEARRKRSQLGKDGRGPWATDTEAMWRKSAVRALQPWLPQVPELVQAVEADETAPPAMLTEAEGEE